MLSQTVDQLLPLLQILQQPAFCIRQDGTVVCNRSAEHLAPASAEALPVWLGGSAELYERWNRSDDLTLPIPLHGETCSASIQSLEDGVLFLLTPGEKLANHADALTVTSQVLRQPLSDLSAMTQQLFEELEETEDPLLQEQTAAINRHIYRISRIACNLADLDRLRSGSYTPCLEKMDLKLFLEELSGELTDICRDAGREWHCSLPDKSMFIIADAMLLERALLNLVSNAIKYGRADSPISLRIGTTSSAVLFQVQNACAEEDCDLLRAAFSRLEQRDILPDPQWGIGLGLPIARYIAQLHGGAVAVEVSHKGMATVTMSVNRTKILDASSVQTPPPFDYSGGMRHSLLELSDSLPSFCFDSISL